MEKNMRSALGSRKWAVLQGDCLPLMADMPDESFTACLCDPPYGLTANKRGGSGSASLNLDSPAGRSRITTGGFMGMAWDHGVPGVAYWAEVLRVLKPGAVLMAFGGTRTHHRLMVAIEDAGFEIFDCMMWLYGSGFPKSTDISKRIDKEAGAEREVIGSRVLTGTAAISADGGKGHSGKMAGVDSRGAKRKISITAPATPDAETWSGYGTGLKPAWENVIVAQKPNPTLTVAQLCRTIMGEHVALLLEAAQWERSQSVANSAGSPLRPSRQNASEAGPSIVARAVSDSHNAEVSGEAALLAANDSTHSKAESCETNRPTVAGNVETSLADDLDQIMATGRVDALLAQTAMLPCELTRAAIDSNTMSLWRNCLGGISRQLSRFTIEMKIELITDLTILNWLLSQNTSANTTRASGTQTNGPSVHAATVGESLSVVAEKWQNTLSRFAVGNATTNGFVPNWEPIILARKPRRGTYAATAVEHGSGALWIDGGRVGTSGATKRSEQAEYPKNADGTEDRSQHWAGVGHKVEPLQAGRWPANLMISHSPGCVRRGERRVKPLEGHRPTPVGKQADGQIKFNEKAVDYQKVSYTDPDGLETIADWDCVPDCAVRLLGEQSGERKSGGVVTGEQQSRTGESGIYGMWGCVANHPHADTGTAARFFKNFDPPMRFVYSAKASRAERDAGLEGMPLHGGHLASPEGGGGGWAKDAAKNPNYPRRNPHPTIKPLAVTRYLATLLRPPEACLDDATILVPFAGSGSEMIGALLAGWRNVVGIELQQEYVDIAEARLTWWTKAMALTHETEPQKILSAMKGRDIDDPVQAPMFNGPLT